MTFDTIDDIIHYNTDHNEIYPLKKYLVPRLQDIDLDTTSNDKISTHESIATLEKIKHVLKLTDNCLKNIKSNLNVEIKEIHLDEPLYTEDDFDEKLYIQKIVEAKLSNSRIIEKKSPSKLLISLRSRNVPIACEKNLQYQHSSEKMSQEQTSHVKSAKNVKFIEIKEENYENVTERRFHSKNLVVQIMPSVNIRSELIEQKFPSVNIEPNERDNRKPDIPQNIAVIRSNHDAIDTIDTIPVKVDFDDKPQNINYASTKKSSNIFNEELKPISFLNMSSFPKKSSEKMSFRRSYSATPTQSIFYNSRNFRNGNLTDGNLTDGPSTSYSSSRKFSNLKKYGITEIQQIYNPKNIKKYTTSKPNVYRNSYSASSQKSPSYSFTSNKFTTPGNKSTIKTFSKTEYIPYSKLTIGGIKASDIQEDISSFTKSRKIKFDDCSDINIESSKVDDFIIKSEQKVDYDEDFDFDKSDSSECSIKNVEIPIESDRNQTVHDKQTLCSKEKIEVFDFVHHIETKDTSTQMIENNHSLYKGTQTSPIHSKISSVIDPSSKFDVQNITTLDLEKILSTFNSRLFIDKTTNPESNPSDKNDQNVDSVEMPHNSKSNNQQIEIKESPIKTAQIMTSPIETIDKQLSPIRNNTEMGVQTNQSLPELHETSGTSSNDTKRLYATIRRSATKPKQSRTPRMYSSSETQTDVSQSESSETLSLGEINLRILKKRYITILNRSDSQITTSSFSTSLNSDVQMDSTLHSKKSEGEISIRQHK